MSRSQPSTELHHLVEVLEHADRVFRTDPASRDEALASGVAAIGALYAAPASPVVARHLEKTYDTCLRALGEAYAGDTRALPGAIGLVQAIRHTTEPRPALPALVRAA